MKLRSLFKFRKRQKTEKDTILYQVNELHDASKVCFTECLKAFSNLGKCLKGGEQ